MNDNELRLLKEARKKIAFLMNEIRTRPEDIYVEEILGWLIIIDDLLDMYN